MVWSPHGISPMNLEETTVILESTKDIEEKTWAIPKITPKTYFKKEYNRDGRAIKKILNYILP